MKHENTLGNEIFFCSLRYHALMSWDRFRRLSLHCWLIEKAASRKIKKSTICLRKYSAHANLHAHKNNRHCKYTLLDFIRCLIWRIKLSLFSIDEMIIKEEKKTAAAVIYLIACFPVEASCWSSFSTNSMVPLRSS